MNERKLCLRCMLLLELCDTAWNHMRANKLRHLIFLYIVKLKYKNTAPMFWQCSSYLFHLRKKCEKMLGFTSPLKFIRIATNIGTL